ncbi:flagellar type III secretion system pore protein FliP [Blastococcus sp. TF02A-30]|uniref:flagellar type III secretion system pore protein FliP n=1 Tax=Blastococcus sp. TF02A-30 TaxID=2250580 RepID=UPI001EEB8988|nr:flagellar type III secretion system pore protein FliP [Blastococcus sp. TF02A-30]
MSTSTLRLPAAAPVRRRALAVVLLSLLTAVAAVVLAGPASAAPTAPTAPVDPTAPVVPGIGGADGGVDISIGDGSPSTSITLIIAITVLSVAPSVLLLATSFTKIIVVLSLTRNALGLQAAPPNQVLTGLALFLTLFVMGPVFGDINEVAVQPYMDGTLTVSQAYDAGVVPLREFLLDNTREDELKLMVGLSGEEAPADAASVTLTTLIPAFVLSELKSAFIIGLVVFIPFLVLDMLVSAALMSMGMMMVPPTIVALPFKLLLFVVVDGWSLITTALVGSYGGGG